MDGSIFLLTWLAPPLLSSRYKHIAQLQEISTTFPHPTFLIQQKIWLKNNCFKARLNRYSHVDVYSRWILETLHILYVVNITIGRHICPMNQNISLGYAFLRKLFVFYSNLSKNLHAQNIPHLEDFQKCSHSSLDL